MIGGFLLGVFLYAVFLVIAAVFLSLRDWVTGERDDEEDF